VCGDAGLDDDPDARVAFAWRFMYAKLKFEKKIEIENWVSRPLGKRVLDEIAQGYCNTDAGGRT
jgi:hypothetical protein